MKTRTAKLTAVAAITIAAAILATPWALAATTNTTSTTNSTLSSNSTNAQTPPFCQQGRGFGPGTSISGSGPPGREFQSQIAANLTVGQRITITSSQGSYSVVGSPTNNGTASGTITFTVTSKLSAGYTLSVTSGSIVVGGTTYNMASGSAQIGPGAESISGQGTTTSTGQFLLQGFARGSFAGASGQLLLDFKAGSTEYAVALTGTVQG